MECLILERVRHIQARNHRKYDQLPKENFSNKIIFRIKNNKKPKRLENSQLSKAANVAMKVF